MAYSSRSINESAFQHFIYSPVTPQMIRYLAFQVTDVIRCRMDPSAQPPAAPPSTPPQDTVESTTCPAADKVPSLELFISCLVRKSNVQVSTLMTTILFLHRLRSRLPPIAKGLPCTPHRIFLATLILSSKYLNDQSPKNKHWAAYSQISSPYPSRSTAVPGYEEFGFTRMEVNLMERQLLGLLDWDLNFNQAELETHFEPFLAPIRQKIEAAIARKLERILKEEKERSLQMAYAQATTQPLPYEIRPEEALVKAAPIFSYHAIRSSDKTAPHSRKRSVSPPPSSEVPGLSRSGTAGTLSSYTTPGTSSVYSSRASSRSRVETPASSINSSASNLHGSDHDPIDMADAESMNYACMQDMSPAALTSHIANQMQGSAKPVQHGHPIPDNSSNGVVKRAKRYRTGLFSRFRHSTTASS